MYEFGVVCDNKAFDSFSRRANEIGFRKAMILYLANGKKWDILFEEFVRWSVQYDLWIKMQLFGESAQQELNKSRLIGSRGPVNLLNNLGEIFTLADYENMRRHRGEEPSKSTLRSWINRGLIKKEGEKYYKMPKQ